MPEAGFRLILCWTPEPGVRPGLERMALNFRKTFWEAVWPRGSPPEESVPGAPREACGPLCCNKRVSFLGSSGYTDVIIPLPCAPLSPPSPNTFQEASNKPWEEPCQRGCLGLGVLPPGASGVQTPRSLAPHHPQDEADAETKAFIFQSHLQQNRGNRESMRSA